MKKISGLLALLVLLTSCENFDGVFRADKSLKLIHTTVFGNERVRTVPAGEYRTEFSFSSEDKMKFTFKGNGEDIDVKIKLPSNRDFPTNRGEINLPASQTGQRYDIQGYLDSETTRSRVFRGNESCTYTRYRTECRTYCDLPRGGCRQVCTQHPYTYRGWRDVEYQNVSTVKDLDLRLVEPSSEEVAADYRGAQRSSYRDYRYQGPCY